MNSLSLARISTRISHQILEREGSLSATQFLQEIISKVPVQNNKEATVLLLTEVGLVNLNSEKDLDASRETIEKAEQLLNELNGVSSAHAPFYKLSTMYFGAVCDHNSVYRESLKYLGCLSVEEMENLSQQEKESWSEKLCMSAL